MIGLESESRPRITEPVWIDVPSDSMYQKVPPGDGKVSRHTFDTSGGQEFEITRIYLVDLRPFHF